MEHKFKNYFYIIISLLLINPIFTIHPRMNLGNRLLDIGNEPIKHNLNNTSNRTRGNSSEDDPYMYFLASYVLFIFLGLYFIALLKRTNDEQLINKTNDVWFFLFFANNGALLMSLFSLAIIIDKFGISIISLSIAISFAGTLIYIFKMKDKRCVDSCFKEGTISEMFNIPCFIIKLVYYTFDCCKCNYVVITTTYRDYYGNRWSEDNYCLVIVALIWNIMMMLMKIMITFYTIISYYIFLLLFSLVLIITKSIYFSFHKKEENIGNAGVDNPNPMNNNVNIASSGNPANIYQNNNDKNLNENIHNNYINEGNNDNQNNNNNNNGYINVNDQNIHTNNNLMNGEDNSNNFNNGISNNPNKITYRIEPPDSRERLNYNNEINNNNNSCSLPNRDSLQDISSINHNINNNFNNDNLNQENLSTNNNNANQVDNRINFNSNQHNNLNKNNDRKNNTNGENIIMNNNANLDNRILDEK